MANGNIGYIIFTGTSYPADLIFSVIVCRALHACLQCQPRAAVRDGPWAGCGSGWGPRRATDTDDAGWWIYCRF